jgi:hypothetical protein
MQQWPAFGHPAKALFFVAMLNTTFNATAVSLRNLWSVRSSLIASFILLERSSSHRSDIYNILWAVVFGFATLNILSLAARRSEPNRRGLSYGELMAVLIVLLSVFLLGSELLSTLHIFPIKIQR